MLCLDIVMIHMDGTDALAQMRRDWAEDAAVGERPLCLACTGNASEADCKRYLKVGFDAVVTKPFTMEDVLAVLQRYGLLKEKGRAV